jgi:hypothetical protein
MRACGCLRTSKGSQADMCGESECARTAERIKVSLREVLVPLRRLSLAGLESLCERRAYADIVPSLGGHPRGGSGRHWCWNVGVVGAKVNVPVQPLTLCPGHLRIMFETSHCLCDAPSETHTLRCYCCICSWMEQVGSRNKRH